MNAHALLLIKALLVTAVFAVLFIAVLLFTTLAVQGHEHPDHWETTAYDIAAGATVVAAYLAVMARITYNFVRRRGAKKI